MAAVRPMKKEDCEAVYQLSCESFSEPWSLESIQKEISNPVATYLVAVESDRVIGFGGIWHVLDEGEIINIAVQKDSQKQGVGKLILQELMKEAENRRLVTMNLEVRASNEPAQRLYSKFGFKEIATRRAYYHEPTEDAIIMQWSLT